MDASLTTGVEDQSSVWRMLPRLPACPRTEPTVGSFGIVHRVVVRLVRLGQTVRSSCRCTFLLDQATQSGDRPVKKPHDRHRNGLRSEKGAPGEGAFFVSEAGEGETTQSPTSPLGLRRSVDQVDG